MDYLVWCFIPFLLPIYGFKEKTYDIHYFLGSPSCLIVCNFHTIHKRGKSFLAFFVYSTKKSTLRRLSDNFKVNDTYGHNIGDQVLQFLAKSLLDDSRPKDVCYRYGGEEFVILLPETNAEEAWIHADQFRKNLSEKESPSGDIITISAGISSYPRNGSTIDNLTLEADKRLYQAKSEGENKVIVNLK
ncbi:MAG: GGDEF domain-containing protein [Paenisporosarcina sp.]